MNNTSEIFFIQSVQSLNHLITYSEIARQIIFISVIVTVNIDITGTFKNYV